MAVTVFKWFSFEAAHSLPHLPKTHKCSRVHGHSYKVRVSCSGWPDGHSGFVIDYADISAVWKEKCEPRLDHHDLNDLLGDQSTSERLAIWIWKQMECLGCLSEVEVRETPTAGSIYSEVREPCGRCDECDAGIRCREL